jgi:hypothetical protein
MFFMQNMLMIISMCWKLWRSPTLVSCVITQLSDIKVTNNLVNTYTNGLNLLAISLITGDSFGWAHGKLILRVFIVASCPFVNMILSLS